GGEPRPAQELQRLVESPARRRAARVVVDDVAMARLGHGRDHRDPPAAPRLATHRGEQRVGRRRLVRDHEHVRQPALTCSGAAAPKIAWRAPGTPYSYGLPTTVGISSKLKIGGGELTCHSSVSDRHGFAPA